MYCSIFLNSLKPNLLCFGEEEIKKKRLEMLIPKIFGFVINILNLFPPDITQAFPHFGTPRFVNIGYFEKQGFFP